MSGITLLGLGVGNPSQLTGEVREALKKAEEIWTPARFQNVIREISVGAKIHFLDESAEYSSRLVEGILEKAQQAEGVFLALSGHPILDSSFAAELVRLARLKGIPLRVLAGISLAQAALSAFREFPAAITLVSAGEVGRAHVPPFSPDKPTLISNISDVQALQEIARVLSATYPANHGLRIIQNLGGENQSEHELSLSEAAAWKNIASPAALLIPALGEYTSLESFQELVARLRAPDGCPWDKAQTHSSLRKHLLEESYEALSALDELNPEKMREEFGDLFLQIVLHAQIAGENRHFGMAEIIQSIVKKIIHRHPHVFGDLEIEDAGEVLQNWEKLKASERATNGAQAAGLLDGLPLALPALSLAQQYQSRAARVGFDWPNLAGVLEKIQEEIQEVNLAEDADALSAEIGDMFFSLVNFARWKNVDAEAALREANLRFNRRFGHVEESAWGQGKTIQELSSEEMETFWQQAKQLGM